MPKKAGLPVAAQPKRKPVPVTKPSDDCAVTVDGEEYFPHTGESIRVWTLAEARDLRLYTKLEALRVKLEAIEGEDGAEAQSIALMDESFEEMCAFLAGRIVEWNWTDMRGNAYPAEPNAEVLRSLTLEELYYLVAACKGETPGERKNGSRPSPITS